MSTAAEFSGHRPHGEDGRVDEQFVRILFVEERADFADRVRGILGRCTRGSFEIVRESNLVEAASLIRGETFDLLLIDLSMADVDRDAAIELANDLAHRLPVVVLTGTETLIDLCSYNPAMGSSERTGTPGLRKPAGASVDPHYSSAMFSAMLTE